MANVKILLIVDTKNINHHNIEKNINFLDNTKYMEIIPAPDYKTVIDAGSMVEWSGAPLDPSTFDCVSIDSIAIEKRSGSVDLFGIPVLVGSGGTIQATVLAHETGGRDEDYTLRFTVIKDKDGSTTSYKIDPKIGVNT